MGSIVYDACLRKSGDIVCKDNAMPKYTDFVSDSGDESSPKIGSTLRVRFPAGYLISDGRGSLLRDAIKATVEHEAVFGRPSEPEHAAFMVYQSSTDEMVPLTQERLDDLVSRERSYFEMIRAMRPFVVVNDLYNYADTKAHGLTLAEGRLEVNTQRHSSENAKYNAPSYDSISLREITEYCPGSDRPADA